ncbi:MAG: ABC transporter ATP-binding protein [Candidatus Margulisiibacteriota bacterium]
MLELINVRKSFGERAALDGVSLSLKQGQILGIVGESGSGKTTLARIACRLIISDRGKILFEGKDTAGLNKDGIKDFRKAVQIIFQEPLSSLDPRIKIGQALSEALEIHTKYSEDRIEREVRKALADIGLDQSFVNRYPHEISGGQCQRACIARALLVNPRLLVLDEPVSSLDQEVQATIIELLLKLKKEKALTYLFITHDLDLAKNFCGRIAVMKDGKIIEEGSAKEIIENPKEDYTKQLVKNCLFEPPPNVR